MSEYKEIDFSTKIPKIELSKLPVAEPVWKTEPFEILTINPEDTIIGDINRQMEVQNELVSKQIDILSSQNSLLSDNYNKLKEVYDAQNQAYKSTQEDLKRSRGYNKWMMIVSVIAMLAAICSPVVTVMLSIKP